MLLDIRMQRFGYACIPAFHFKSVNLQAFARYGLSVSIRQGRNAFRFHRLLGCRKYLLLMVDVPSSTSSPIIPVGEITTDGGRKPGNNINKSGYKTDKLT